MQPVATQIFDRLERWARDYPDRPAHRVASPGSTDTASLSYRELHARVSALARHLRTVLPDDRSPVVVTGHKEPEMLVGFLGAVRSGHPYIPVDDSLPAHRVQEVERISGSRLTLTPRMVASLTAHASGTTEGGGGHLPLQPESPFYTIFTSGSTGEPKGVVITAGCLDAFLDWMLAEHPLAEGQEVFLNQAPFSFDLSVMDLYLSLATGGTLFSLTRREIADFRSLFRALGEPGLTAWVSTPSFAQLCLAERTFAADRLPAMRRFLFCGETLLPETASRLLERFPAAEVWNTYGPTEATVATTSIRITPEIIARGGPLPIGLPRPGTDIYLLDEQEAAPPPGERGQLIIAGPNVSPGYLGRADLTARAFFTTRGQRAYRTGDWGRWRDGLLYFEGRQDGQVKLHGYRIELADIEANLGALAAVRDCAVVPVVKAGAVQSLAAFVVPAGNCPDEPAAAAAVTDDLRAHLAARLPAYMVPRKIYLRHFLPLTANGKADRRRLAEDAAAGGSPGPLP